MWLVRAALSNFHAVLVLMMLVPDLLKRPLSVMDYGTAPLEQIPILLERIYVWITIYTRSQAFFLHNFVIRAEQLRLMLKYG